MTLSSQEAAIANFHADRWLAHRVLFHKRHPQEPCPAHRELVRAIYDPRPRRLIEGFRGIGKSTYLEEAALLRAGFQEFRFMVIVGASYSRAADRLTAIKREIEVNDLLIRVFGQMKGPIWQEGRIVLANGACIQAMGRDQSMLGMKYLDIRPDAALIDDVEDPDEVRTDADREQTWDWFTKTFLPSLDHPIFTWARALGTRRGVGSLPERLEKDGWPTTKLPLEHPGPTGERTATWEGKFPLPVCDAIRQTYRGNMHVFMQEYMCQPYSASDRIFSPDMFVVEERRPSWHATYAMIDPARTTNRNSATTGWAVWSWIGPRLVVWAAGAETLKPDEIIDLAFTIHDAYDPVWIGIEEDGLNEWLKQPLRTEMARRHVSLPFKPVRAPRGKIQFISGLQPYFAAREVHFAQPLPDLQSQLLSFPTGKIDAPNALAYALQMRPAAPVYESFGQDHIAADLQIVPNRPVYLAANAVRANVSAALVQFVDDRLLVYADWVVEGEPAETVAALHAEASAFGDTSHDEATPPSRDWIEALKAPVTRFHVTRQPVRWVVPPIHKDRFNNVGLLQAIARIPAVAAVGGEADAGRVDLRDRFGRNSRGAPAVVVGDAARWTLRALSGGYSKSVDRRGALSDAPEDGAYRVLMEGIESFAAMISRPQPEENEAEQNFSFDKRGRRYLSAIPAR